MSERNEWESFLQLRANQAKLTLAESEAFLLRFCQQNLDKEEKEIAEILEQDRNSLNNFKKQMTEVYKKFSKRYLELQLRHHKFKPLWKCLEQEYEQWLSTPDRDASGSSTISIDWREFCNRMLKPQRELSSNSLLHAYEDAKFERQQIYVPLALIERKKPDKREGAGDPEAGTKLYEPEYEEKQRFEHDAFLEQILVKGEGKSKGKQIALIGEPGAGKTTLLQTIADWILERELGLPIWISLADLGQQATFNIWNYLQSSLLSQEISPTPKSIVETELEKEIQEGRVWLLLDGVDEVATSGIQTLQAIAQQLRGWLAQSQVILTCRLNVWNADKNALAEFETYRLLDLDYPQQVHQFIDNWFINGNAEKKKRLKAELDNPEKARLRDLIQNPLRLALLCASWQSREGNLPETKAGLYAQFVEQYYKWKSDRFPISHQEKIALNQALGRLALQDIDTGTTRFRLRESFIREAIGNDYLFEKASKLGWLNNVGFAAESASQEKVYAFFHASFEEYFAALAIEDRDYFVPRNHVDKPVEGKQYRIFEPQWKEVILLWLGREDVNKKHKEEFVKALVEFGDGCGEWNFESVDRGFYEYRAYQLAAIAIVEFKDCVKADGIVKAIVRWCFGYSDLKTGKSITFLDTIAEVNRPILSATDRTRTIAALIDLIGTSRNEDTRRQAVWSLRQFSPGNPEAIAALIDLIRTSPDESTRRLAAESLGEIAPGNPEAIAALIELIRTSRNEDTCWQAVNSLGEIGTGNSNAIDTLVYLIEFRQYFTSPFFTVNIIRTLEKIGKDNEAVITTIVKLIETSNNQLILQQASMSLEKMGKDNPIAINALANSISNSKNEFVLLRASQTLLKIDQGNLTALATLINLYDNAGVRDNIYFFNEITFALSDICVREPKNIASLVELSGQSRNEESIIWQLVQVGLDEIGKDEIEKYLQLYNSSLMKSIREHKEKSYSRVRYENILKEYPPAIICLLDLIYTSKNEDIILQAASSLLNINKGNQQAIPALIELIRTSQDEYTHKQAAEILGNMRQGNREAIATLIDLIRTSQDKDTRRQAAESLGKIAPGNPEAIAVLIELIRTSPDTRRQAAVILEKIVQDDQMAGVVTALQDCLSDETYENDFELFEASYEVIWKCAQTLSYPEFYQAWHNPPIAPHPEVLDNTPVGNTPIVQSLENQIADLCNQLNSSSCFCINAQTLADMTDTAEIAQELCNQIFFKFSPNEIPAVANAPQLKRHLIPLKQQNSNLALIFHQGAPAPTLLRLCRQIADIIPIAWITDSLIEPPLRGFPPQQPNLLNAIQAWLEET